MITPVTWMRSDPRGLQLFAQISIIFYATAFLDYNFFWIGALGLYCTGLLSCRLWGRPELANLSFLNTTLSGLILIRCESLWIWMSFGLFTIAVKLLAKKSGRPIFNPSNFALVLGLTLFPDYVWIDPGLWAQDERVILFCLLMGFVVAKKAQVSTASLSFLLSMILFEVSRAMGLGDPLGIPLHNLKSGSLFIFTFFTLTDPKTAPKNIGLQILYAFLISSLSFVLRYGLFLRGAWFYALFLVNILMPLLLAIINPHSQRVFSWKKSALAS